MSVMKKLLYIVMVFSLFNIAQAFAVELNDPKELESFVDGVMGVYLSEHNIPGATISVVKDGRLFFIKGYGYADIDNLKVVDPYKTLFRPGSVSKLFTWTALMQLVEEGKVDLNADVNTYLKDFKIPVTYSRPITIANLLTHTPGFEDSFISGMTEDRARLLPLKEYLKKYMPARIRVPGEMASYSNYAAALAGYIVEKISGMAFNDYCREKIFKPLGMVSTTFDQKEASQILENLSYGYTYDDGKFKKQKFEFIIAAPAGASVSTASDMANFMIAHLQNGSFKEARILKESTAKDMHEKHFTFDKKLNGVCYGFYQMNSNGQSVIGHGGDTVYFHSLLALFPEKNIGIFVSYNSPGGEEAGAELLRSFMGHYFPLSFTKVELQKSFEKDASKVEGTYVSMRRPYATFEKIAQVFRPAQEVLPRPDGTIKVGKGRIIEIGPYFFRALYGNNTLMFKEINGKVAYLLVNNIPVIAFERQSWHETSFFHLTMLSCCMLIFLAALIGWPISYFCSRKSKKKVSLFSIFAHWLALITCALFIISIPLIMGLIQKAVYSEYLGLMLAMLSVPLAGAALSIGVLICAIFAWKNNYWSKRERLNYTIVTVTMFIFIWWLNYWNVLGYRF